MTRVEFETMVSDFIAEYEAANGYYGGEWPTVAALIRCRTDGCVRNDDSVVEVAHISIPLDGVWKVVCGRCSRPVEDLNPELSDDPSYRLPARYPDGSSWMVVDD